YFEKGLKLDEAIKGAEHPDVGVSLLNLSIVERTAGRLEKATQHVERALAIFRAVYGDGHPHTLKARDSLASILKLRGDYDGARREYETSLAAWTDLYGPDDPRLAQTLGNLGSLESHVGDHERAAELLARSLKLRQSKSSPRPSAVAIDELNYACAIRELGRLDEALRVLQQAHKRLEPLGSNSQLLWIAKVEIAATKLALGRSDIAREALEELSASPLAAEVSPTNRGAVHFELAKAIMATDRDMARARTLAEHAVEAFTERSMDAEYLEEARTWLAGLPSTSSR
ncbi:MAG: tetratricopeptide repeat protein, partial [Nannocystaceae bacterium]